MSAYFLIKTLHIISATILFGTGLGIAFFMFRSWFTDDLHEKLFALRTTVLADYLFTAPAAVLQPATGAWLIWSGGFRWTEGWLVATYILYAMAAACWLPVVWIQVRLRDLAREAVLRDAPMPPRFDRLYRVWFACGFPAFAAVLAIVWLMLTRPPLAWP